MRDVKLWWCGELCRLWSLNRKGKKNTDVKWADSSWKLDTSMIIALLNQKRGWMVIYFKKPVWVQQAQKSENCIFSYIRPWNSESQKRKKNPINLNFLVTFHVAIQLVFQSHWLMCKIFSSSYKFVTSVTYPLSHH